MADQSTPVADSPSKAAPPNPPSGVAGTAPPAGPSTAGKGSVAPPAAGTPPAGTPPAGPPPAGTSPAGTPPTPGGAQPAGTSSGSADGKTVGGAPSTTTVQSRIEHTTAQQINVIGEQTLHEIKAAFYGDPSHAFTVFSMSMADAIPAAATEAAAHAYIDDAEISDRYVDRLAEHRILLLVGDPDSGKYATALYLAHRLRLRDASLTEDTLSIAPLGADVRIDLRETLRDANQCGRRVICFRDVLAWGNADLKEFLRDLDDARIAAMARDLESHSAYLILTSSVQPLRRHLDTDLHALRVYDRMTPLSAGGLARGLQACLSRAALGARVTDVQRARILDRVRSISQIFRFMRDYLESVVDGALELDQALARLDDVPSWFLKELPHDHFDTWSTGFVLTLAHARSSSNGVAVTEFHALYQALAPSLRQIVGHTEGEEEERKPFRPERASDDHAVRRTRSRITRHHDSGRDMWSFEEQDYPERLWPAMLTHSRQLLLSLVPTLEALVNHADSVLRIRAAQILGRIGEIDPVAITGRLIRRWARADALSTRAAVGHLIDGALSSHDDRYRQQCLAEIRRLSRADEPEDENRGGRDVWTAIAAYKQLGARDLPTAMAHLREIAERVVAERFEEFRDIDKMLEVAARAEGAREGRADSRVKFQWFSHEVLRVLIPVILTDQHVRTLYALQYTLVTLCLTRDPVDVLKSLEDWLKGRPGLRAVVAWIFLQPDGMADALRDRWITGDAPLGIDAGSSPLIASLTARKAGQATMLSFLEKLYCSFDPPATRVGTTSAARPLPDYVIERFRASYWSHLYEWAAAAMPHRDGRQAIEDMMVNLLQSEQARIGKDLLELLKNRTHRADDPDWAAFADRVIQRSM